MLSRISRNILAALPGDQKLMKKASGPFTGYKPELDESPDLDPTRANFYQSHIGILVRGLGTH
jgi:hypothetical protein